MVVDVNNLLENDFGLMKAISCHGWERYFELRNEPCYHYLVKDFWIRAHVHEKIEIKSDILGVPISITHKLLAHILQCTNEGIKVNKLSHDNG
jgi:hypothetical protein